MMIGDRVLQQEQKMVKKIKHYIYDPQEVVGSGFNSKVFKGFNELTKEAIAVKVLELAKIQSEVEKYLLNNEINALRALTHPHVLRTVEILMTKNNVYIMTELCEGGDLQQHIRKQGRLSQLEALRITRDIADGYLAIEQKLIVHRDLKAANIFLTTSGARIADFGFCEFINETKKPQLFYNVGSPPYMSPQSYLDNIYSAKSDLWSIGIVLYEMLAGDTPDKNLTYTQMSNNLMAGKFTCPNDGIRHILTLCFKRDLKERIGTLQLIEMVNAEILKLEGGRAGRQQPQANRQLNPSNSMHSLETVRPNNRPLAASLLPFQEQQPEPIFSGQSPLKAKFNGIMVRQNSGRNMVSSPMMFVDQRFSRQEPARVANRIKTATEMLLFLYRLLNALAEVNLQLSSLMSLILFRHRSFLEMQAERIAQEDHLDRNTFEPLKEFHFLKGRFDDDYLQKVAQQSSQPSSLANRLQELANVPFTDPKSIEAYCGACLQVASECDNKLQTADEGSTNKIAVIMDYLLLHCEILELYSEGTPIEAIVQEFMQLPSLLKDQPKRITPLHLALLRHKLRLVTHQEEEQRHNFEDSRSFKQLAEMPERKALIMNGFF